MSVLILCDAGDTSAHWIEWGLQRRDVPVLLVTGADLTVARQMGHTVGADSPRLRIRLRDGRTFTHRSVVGVVSRLTYLPEPGDARVPASDRRYAREEMNAITLSWMSALAETVPFVGRPSPSWLGGVWRGPAEWAVLAHAAGLTAAPVVLPSEFESPPSEQAVVASALVIADVAWLSGPGVAGYGRQALREGLVRLARMADADTLGVGFDRHGRVARVELVPDLRPTGEAGLSRLAQLVGCGGGDA